MAKEAASQLKTAFEMPQEEIGEDWSLATLLVDAGGPWFNGSVWEFLEIIQADEDRTVPDAEENRRFVLENLLPATSVVADFLQDKAAKDRWRSFWAEVPLLTGPGHARPSVLKVDQIAFLGRRNCCLIELKVTAGSYNDVFERHQASCAERFRAFREVLSSQGFDVVDSRLLIADARGKRPPAWEDIEL
jgi:hypothetical protein